MGSVLLITFEVSVLHIVLDSLCTSIGSIVFKCEGKDIYFEYNRLINTAFLWICLSALLLGCIMSITGSRGRFY